MTDALEEAEDFLWRYPEVVTDVDDPIEIIRALTCNAENHQAEIDEVDLRNVELEERIKTLEHENVELRVLVMGLQRRLEIRQEGFPRP